MIEALERLKEDDYERSDIDKIMSAVISCINDDNKIATIVLMRVLKQTIDNVLLQSVPPSPCYKHCCSKCGKLLRIDPTLCLTSIPPRYQGRCVECGYTESSIQ